MKPANEFRMALRYSMVLRMNALQRDGTTGMSFDNFFQMVAGQIPQGGPRGTNATYYLKQIMREIIAAMNPKQRSFFLD